MILRNVTIIIKDKENIIQINLIAEKVNSTEKKNSFSLKNDYKYCYINN